MSLHYRVPRCYKMASISSILFFASIICLGVEGLVDSLAYPVAVAVPVPVAVGVPYMVNVEQFMNDVEAHEHPQEAESEEEEGNKTEDEDEEDELEDVVASHVSQH